MHKEIFELIWNYKLKVDQKKDTYWKVIAIAMAHLIILQTRCFNFFFLISVNTDTDQGRIQDFKLGGTHLKKNAPSGGRRENFGVVLILLHLRNVPMNYVEIFG
jgi:hypothetical protein